MRTAGELKGGTIKAMDGDIGSAQDLYFDDRTWTVRYVVVDTGAWLPGRQVLISPFAFQPVPGASWLRTFLSKKQIENSPSLDGALAYPALPLEAPLTGPIEREMLARGDPNLRSARDVMGYYISATDGDLGHVEDLLIDDKTWAIYYIIVDTRNWLPGRRVLVSPEWIREVSWEDSKVYVNLSKRHIEAAPEFEHSGERSRRKAE